MEKEMVKKTGKQVLTTYSCQICVTNVSVTILRGKGRVPLVS